jgi:hypothetical protein
MGSPSIVLKWTGPSPDRLSLADPVGWDMSFATNHLGPFALTEALMPSLPNGANVVFIVSAVEDPGRKPAVAAGFRGGSYISAEASARGEWKPGGAKRSGFDAYATSKQAILAAAMVLARETPRLQRDRAGPESNHRSRRRRCRRLRALSAEIHRPAPRAALHALHQDLEHSEASRARNHQDPADASGQTGVYYDEGGHPMEGSTLVCDPNFQDRVVAETRALLAKIPTFAAAR